MIDDVARVVLGAVDEGRLAAAQHRQPDARRGRARRRRRRRAAGGPCDRAPARRASDSPGESRWPRRSMRISPLARSSASRERGRHARRLEALGRRRRRASRRASPRAHSSKVSSSRSILRSASANWLRRPPENSARPSRIAASRPTISTPAALSALRSSVRALGRADELRRRQPARARQIVDLVVALIPDARRLHPPQHVAAAIRPRQPHVLADRERDRAGRSAGSRRRAARRSPTRRRPARRRRAAAADCGSRARSAIDDRRRHRLRAAPARCARLQAPLASTTLRQRSSPRSVTT